MFGTFCHARPLVYMLIQANPHDVICNYVELLTMLIVSCYVARNP